MRAPPPAVLVFAANDPSGGAGIQADILSLASIGCHPLPVITGLTVQDSSRVEALLAMDAKWVDVQARCILEDMPIAAIKLGLLCAPCPMRFCAPVSRSSFST